MGRKRTVGKDAVNVRGSTTVKTLADVARALGVDPSTVSLALSGSPKISETTRTRILKFCEKVNFQPNQFARWLSRGKTGLVGIIFPSIESSFFPQVLEGVEEVLDEAGLSGLLAISGYEPSVLRREVLSLLSKRVEGLVIVPPGVPGEGAAIAKLVENVPTVWLIHPIEGKGFDTCVHVDNEGGGYLGTMHLLEHGFRHFVFLTGPKNSRVAKMRLNGWRRALLEAGLDPEDHLCCGDDFSSKAGYDAIMSVWKSLKKPVGIMSSSDYAALGCIQALVVKHARLGNDYGVVGFDGICCARFSPIPLTTVNQPKVQLGRAAATLLLEKLKGNEPTPPALPASLIIRRSCGCSQVADDVVMA